MAGFWHLSSTMMFDQVGRPAPGAQAFFYDPDVLQDLAVYRDSALVTPWNQPVSADGYGRMPNVYLDDSAASFYRFRVTDAAGVELIALATIPILSPGGGGGGGSAVDPTTVLNTGDTWWSPMNGTRAGAVRCNAMTIGSATSGATERANADTQALFLFLWQALTNTICPVSGGRGASAAADFSANKRIGLPDLRGRACFGLDTMGNTAANRIGGSIYSPGGSAPGSAGGVEKITITANHLPAHTHALGTIGAAAGANVVAQLSGASQSGINTTTATQLPILPPGMVGTVFIKL